MRNQTKNQQRKRKLTMKPFQGHPVVKKPVKKSVSKLKGAKTEGTKSSLKKEGNLKKLRHQTKQEISNEKES